MKSLRGFQSHLSWTFAVWVALVLLVPSTCSSQELEQPSLAGDVVKSVFLDPTTYAPAVIAYTATMKDWNTSQPFFQSGYYEQNARFTVSGRPNDVPLGYSEGKRRILLDAFAIAQVSLVNNATNNLVEHVLIKRYPQHRKLLKTLGWVQRISFASYMSYRLSAPHFRQATFNQQQAQMLGIR